MGVNNQKSIISFSGQQTLNYRGADERMTKNSPLNDLTSSNSFMLRNNKQMIFRSLFKKGFVKPDLSSFVLDSKVDDIMVKVYKYKSNKFLMRIRRYFFGIPVTIGETTIEDCEAAEDFLSDLNVNYPLIVQLRKSVRELFNRLNED